MDPVRPRGLRRMGTAPSMIVLSAKGFRYRSTV